MRLVRREYDILISALDAVVKEYQLEGPELPALRDRLKKSRPPGLVGCDPIPQWYFDDLRKAVGT